MGDKHYCPMTFGNSNERGAWLECSEECAWLVNERNGCNSCAITLIALGVSLKSKERTCRINMPVIDWETGEADYKCSSCGFSADPQDWAEEYVYCPHCGARVIADN